MVFSFVANGPKMTPKMVLGVAPLDDLATESNIPPIRRSSQGLKFAELYTSFDLNLKLLTTYSQHQKS